MRTAVKGWPDNPRRSAFTLVEMLVVIAIIGILVALLVPTIGGVMVSSRNAAMAIEMKDIEKAIESYKSFATDFPPDFSNAQAVAAHVSKAFNRNTRNVGTWLASSDPTGPSSSRAMANLDPAEALVLWLSLLSSNPRDPLSGVAFNYTGERKVFFTFDPSRLIDLDQDGWNEYAPKYAPTSPYVYFDGRLQNGAYAYGGTAYPLNNASPLIPTLGRARPYRSNTLIDARDNNRTQPRPVILTDTNDAQYPNRTQWLKPGAFQLLCAGLDNHFGIDAVSGTTLIYKQFPAPNSPAYTATAEDADNLGSFAEMKTLGDSIP